MEFHAHKNSSDRATMILYGTIGDDFDGVTDNQFAHALEGLGNVSSIDVHLNSPGGDFFHGVAIYNQLVQNNAKINMFIDGLAASAASLIAMAGDVIQIASNGSLMIHEAWTLSIGNKRDLAKSIEVLGMVDRSLVMTYARRTGKSESEITRLLIAETWMQGAEAVRMGFADSVMPAKAKAATVDSRVAAHYRDPGIELEHMRMRLALAKAQF